MVKKIITDGNCLYCSNSYSGIATMTKHLESCEKRKNFYLEINKKIKTNKSDDTKKYCFSFKCLFQLLSRILDVS